MSTNIFPLFSRHIPANVVRIPDKRLRQPARKVSFFNSHTNEVVRKLLNTVRRLDYKYNPWLGMSAQQIGYQEQIIVVKKSYKKYLIMINPQILATKWKFPSVSTCYSVKGLYLLPRYFWIKVKYQNEQGKWEEKVIRGGKATVLQQELEHLQGKLISD